MKRVTLGDIGKKLGFSQATISMALRDHPSIPPGTREKVRALAAQMGYRPDPALSALIAYRQTKRDAKYQATLAWVDQECPKPIHDLPLKIYEGVCNRAEKLGFLVESFSASTPEDWLQLAKTLRARRIEGILIPHPADHHHCKLPLDFPWEEFCTVAIARATCPAQHMVVNDQHQSAALAVQELHALGYRRIGITIPSTFANGTELRFLGGYLWECECLKIPPLYFVDHAPGNDRFAKHAAKWIVQHRLDAVIASGDGDILPVLQQAGLRTPDDIAVAILAIQPSHPELAGIDQNFEHIGEMAVNQVADLIRRNERGIPPDPLRLLVQGRWVPAASAPPATNPKAMIP